MTKLVIELKRTKQLIFTITKTPGVQMNILLLEDSPSHRREAYAEIQARGHEAKGGYRYWNVASENIQYDIDEIDGAILDVHGPFYIRELHGSLQDDYPHEESEDTPGGVVVAFELLKRGIPVVLCTDGYHHARKLEWLYRLVNILIREGKPIRMVDSVPADKVDRDTWKAVHKPWGEAINRLETLVAEKRAEAL